jgi:hypothetical protein
MACHALPSSVLRRNNPLSGPKSFFHFKIAELLVRDDDASVAGDVLRAGDGAVDDLPLPARLVAARPGMPGFRADMPALERRAVKQRDPSALIGGTPGNTNRPEGRDK